MYVNAFSLPITPLCLVTNRRPHTRRSLQNVAATFALHTSNLPRISLFLGIIRSPIYSHQEQTQSPSKGSHNHSKPRVQARVLWVRRNILARIEGMLHILMKSSGKQLYSLLTSSNKNTYKMVCWNFFHVYQETIKLIISLCRVITCCSASTDGVLEWCTPAYLFLRAPTQGHR